MSLQKYQIKYNILCLNLMSLYSLLLNSSFYKTLLYIGTNDNGLHITVLDSNGADENLDMLKKAE